MWGSVDMQFIHGLVDAGRITAEELRWLAHARAHQIVRRFFNDVDTFGDILRSSGAVVSGSASLAFFIGPCHVRPGDLDIYVPAGQEANLLTWLTEQERYMPSSSWPMSDNLGERFDDFDDYCDVDGYRRIVRLERDGSWIDVVVVAGESALLAISKFWTTILFSFFTLDGYCCAYPEMLHLRRSMVAQCVLSSGLSQIVGPIMKYRTRGVRLFRSYRSWREGTEGHCTGGTTCPSKWRFFGDRGCLIGFFDQDRSMEKDAALLGRMHIAVVWRLGGEACYMGRCGNTGGYSGEQFELSEGFIDIAQRWLDTRSNTDLSACELRDLVRDRNFVVGRLYCH